MTDKGVVWLSVISSAPGTQGYADAAKANDEAKASDAHPTAILLRREGATWVKLYEAKTTPHMFRRRHPTAPSSTRAPSTTSRRSTRRRWRAPRIRAPGDHEATAGKAVSEPATNSYGCSVKYSN
jgi:hypothetical protein